MKLLCNRHSTIFLLFLYFQGRTLSKILSAFFFFAVKNTCFHNTWGSNTHLLTKSSYKLLNISPSWVVTSILLCQKFCFENDVQSLSIDYRSGNQCVMKLYGQSNSNRHIYLSQYSRKDFRRTRAFYDTKWICVIELV